MSFEPRGPVVGIDNPTHVEPSASIPRLPLRLATFDTLTTIGLFMVWGAVPQVLLPLQIEQIDPGNKAQNFAMVLAIGALVALVVQPVAGLVSDRTRSRFGRRTPWLVLGGLIGGLALIKMGSSTSLLGLIVPWIIVQVAYNFAQGPLSAVLADRVPRAVRGTFSALIGLGTLLGVTGGQVVASGFTSNIPAGYWLFGGIALVALVTFSVFNPEKSTARAIIRPLSVREALGSLWVSPRKHPDFFWGFAGRLLLFVGYYLVSGYLLYILQDYLHLGASAPAAVSTVAIFTLVGIVVSAPIGGRVSDRIGRRKPVVVAAGALMAFALLIPLVFRSEAGVCAYGLVSGLGYGAYIAVDQALMSSVLPSTSSIAKDLGILNIAAAAPQLVGPLLAGTVVQLTHGYVALFPIGIGVAVLGALAVLPIRSVR